VLKIIGIVVATCVLIVIIGMMIAISRNNGRPVKRARRRVARDDDD
jgi:hypothetical protein